MKLQRRHQQQRNGSLWAPGLSLWKYSILKPFLDTGVNRLSFSRPCVETTACVVWGVHGERRWEQEANARHLPIWRMEDGFLRSSGLGSDLLAPLSLVLDKRGIYYDATRPSDLEDMLNKSMLSTTQLSRVEKLMKRLVASKLSKYNLGAEFSVPAESYGKRIILVPGQVETDASIQKGAFSINTNLKLLSIVRERNPDAYIIYKPHPDVLVGNRLGHISQHIVSQYADFQVLDADIIQCIQVADEVHTMTSLAGFEALLHGKHVYCYGLPFYAGWGLTHDEHRCERRQRKLRLEEMVYQVLIRYPTYIHPQRWEAITAEEAVEILIGTPRTALVIRKNKWDKLKRNVRKIKMFCKIKLFL